MCKYSQGFKGNEFTVECRKKYTEIMYIDINNDPIEGVINVKGSV